MACVLFESVLTVFKYNTIVPSTAVFSHFDKGQLQKIRRHYWKERLKISKTVKFESDTSNPREDKGDREGIPHTHPIPYK